MHHLSLLVPTAMSAMGTAPAASGPGGALDLDQSALQHGQELDDNFTGIAVRRACVAFWQKPRSTLRKFTLLCQKQDANGRMSIAGFGSLLSIDSARSTFPDLRSFRIRKVRGHSSSWIRILSKTPKRVLRTCSLPRRPCRQQSSPSCITVAPDCQNQHADTGVADVFSAILHESLQRCTPLQVDGFRRVFAHTAPIFFQRGIARLDTLEISSLSCEEAPSHSIVVSVFDVPYSPDIVAVSISLLQKGNIYGEAPSHSIVVSVVDVHYSSEMVAVRSHSGSFCGTSCRIILASSVSCTCAQDGRCIMCLQSFSIAQMSKAVP